MFKKNSLFGFFLFLMVLVNNLYANQLPYSIEFNSLSQSTKQLHYSKPENNNQNIVFANFLPSELQNSENTDAEDDDLPSALMIAELKYCNNDIALSNNSKTSRQYQNTIAPIHVKLFKLYCSLKLGDSAHQ